MNTSDKREFFGTAAGGTGSFHAKGNKQSANVNSMTTYEPCELRENKGDRVSYFANQLTGRVQGYPLTRQPTQLTCPKRQNSCKTSILGKFAACLVPNLRLMPPRQKT